MKDKSKKKDAAVVPLNTEGKQVDIEKSVSKTSTELAIGTFKKVCERLLRPVMWEKLQDGPGATFSLEKLNNKSENATIMEVNDYLKIDIPGPGPREGEGFDWVIVENIDLDVDAAADESFTIRLRASTNPNNKQNNTTSHFFKDSATSTFIIKRKENIISASYHGRNEIPNVEGVNLHDKIRNSFVAMGALAGLSELQWTTLLNGLLKEE